MTIRRIVKIATLTFVIGLCWVNRADASSGCDNNFYCWYSGAYALALCDTGDPNAQAHCIQQCTGGGYPNSLGFWTCHTPDEIECDCYPYGA
jgi:hypothetical protein